MSQYQFSESNVIRDVTFIRSVNGSMRAYLRAAENVPAETLHDITCTFADKGWQCIPHSFEGKPALEVRGFVRDTKLMEELKDHQWVSGEQAYLKDPPQKISFSEKLKKRSLQASGWFYSLGDAGFIAYGIKDSSPLDTAAGIFYGLPTPVLIAYGQNDQADFQVKDIGRKMVDYMKQNKIELPQECSLDAILADRKKGLIQNAQDLMRRYPSEFMNLSYATAGACILAAAVKHLTHGVPAKGAVDGWMKKLAETQHNVTHEMAYAAAKKSMIQENYLNAGVGVMTIGSGLTATMIKEKVHDPDSEKKTGVEGMVEWLREHPLTIAGVGYMASTLMHAGSTYVAMQGADAKHKQAVPFRALFVGASLIAELLVAMSSKGHGDGVVSDVSVDHSAISLAADLIVRQPTHMQEYLVDHTASFLARPDVLAMKESEVTSLLRQEVELMRDNPWAHAAPKTTTVPQSSSAGSAIDHKALPPGWQAKLSGEAGCITGAHIPH